MHDQGVVHGDLKGVCFQATWSPCGLPCSQANILIDYGGHARLADFSLLTIVSDQSTVISTCIQGGTVQWMSPELIDPDRFGLEKTRPTKESDCYALGMVVYEVLSGRTPFAPWKSPLVIQKVLEGERPGRPRGEEGKLFTDGIWKVLEHCWKHQPKERISTEVVLQCLERTPLLSWPDASGIAEPDTDGQSYVTASDSSVSSVSSGISGSPSTTVVVQQVRRLHVVTTGFLFHHRTFPRRRWSPVRFPHPSPTLRLTPVVLVA